MPLLQVTGLRTEFHTDAGIARAVDGVSFGVEHGEALGIVGESGCGKSVTALSLMRLIVEPGRILPGSSVRLAGRELLELGETEMREVRGGEMAMVFQEPTTSLNPVFPIGEQIAETVRLHRRVGRRAARARAVDMLRLVGMPEPEARAGDYPHQLSGGMRQRVMVAIALCCEPAILIADEPTTALDVTIQAQILEVLAGLGDRLGMAMILISHDLGVVAQLCERVAVMYAGQIVESGRTGALFREPRHPYTEGLLNAIPRPGRRAQRLPAIPGAVPSGLAWPTGCRFHPRCPFAWEKCLEPPPLAPAGPDRESRCWLDSFPQRRNDVRWQPAFVDAAGRDEVGA